MNKYELQEWGDRLRDESIYLEQIQQIKEGDDVDVDIKKFEADCIKSLQDSELMIKKMKTLKGYQSVELVPINYKTMSLSQIQIIITHNANLMKKQCDILDKQAEERMITQLYILSDRQTGGHLEQLEN